MRGFHFKIPGYLIKVENISFLDITLTDQVVDFVDELYHYFLCIIR